MKTNLTLADLEIRKFGNSWYVVSPKYESEADAQKAWNALSAWIDERVSEAYSDGDCAGWEGGYEAGREDASQG